MERIKATLHNNSKLEGDVVMYNGDVVILANATVTHENGKMDKFNNYYNLDMVNETTKCSIIRD